MAAKKPPYRIVLPLLLGSVMGIGIYTFLYARGYSYLSDNPAACINCHVMNEQYNGWIKGSHRSVAVCNDCHTPATFAGKYTTKALNGFWHSWYFTTERFPDNIQITQRNKNVVEEACRRCHADIVTAIDGSHTESQRTTCLQCHSSVGHLE